MKGAVMRRSKELRHPRIGDDVFLSAAVLAVENARYQHTRVANDEAPRFHDELEAGGFNEREYRSREPVKIGRLFGIVANPEATANVQIS